MSDTKLTKFLANVVGVVEATSYEQLKLWDENAKRPTPRDWKENNSGFLETIGNFNDMPVCISLWTAVIDGQKTLFFEATSQVVDHRMIGEWLKANLPKTALREDGYVRKTDPMNFHNLFLT